VIVFYSVSWVNHSERSADENSVDLYVCRAVLLCIQELYQAGEKKLGTDESKFNQILCSQSYDQLRQVFQEYKNIAHKGLDQSIRSEMSGDLERGMLTIGSHPLSFYYSNNRLTYCKLGQFLF